MNRPLAGTITRAVVDALLALASPFRRRMRPSTRLAAVFAAVVFTTTAATAVLPSTPLPERVEAALLVAALVALAASYALPSRVANVALVAGYVLAAAWFAMACVLDPRAVVITAAALATYQTVKWARRFQWRGDRITVGPFELDDPYDARAANRQVGDALENARRPIRWALADAYAVLRPTTFGHTPQGGEYRAEVWFTDSDVTRPREVRAEVRRLHSGRTPAQVRAEETHRAQADRAFQSARFRDLLAHPSAREPQPRPEPRTTPLPTLRDPDWWNTAGLVTYAHHRSGRTCLLHPVDGWRTRPPGQGWDNTEDCTLNHAADGPEWTYVPADEPEGADA